MNKEIFKGRISNDVGPFQLYRSGTAGKDALGTGNLKRKCNDLALVS